MEGGKQNQIQYTQETLTTKEWKNEKLGASQQTTNQLNIWMKQWGFFLNYDDASCRKKQLKLKDIFNLFIMAWAREHSGLMEQSTECQVEEPNLQ